MFLIAFCILIAILLVLKYFDCILTYKATKNDPNNELSRFGRRFIKKIGALRAVIIIYLIFILLCIAILGYFVYGDFTDKVIAFIAFTYLIILHWFVVLSNKNFIEENHEKANSYRKIVMFLIGYPILRKLKLVY